MSITTMMLRWVNRKPLCPLPTMTPSVPWIVALQDIRGTARLLQQLQFFLRWQ
jgi:hypothetical protein